MSRCPEIGCKGRMRERRCETCGFSAYKGRGSHFSSGIGGPKDDPWVGRWKREVQTHVDLGDLGATEVMVVVP